MQQLSKLWRACADRFAARRPQREDACELEVVATPGDMDELAAQRAIREQELFIERLDPETQRLVRESRARAKVLRRKSGLSEQLARDAMKQVFPPSAAELASPSATRLVDVETPNVRYRVKVTFTPRD